MTTHRFIDPTLKLDQKEVNITNSRIIHQIQRVLRMRRGDRIILGEGNGKEAEARILEIGKKNVLVGVENHFTNNREPDAELNLYVSILKKDKMEWLAEKVTEIGVTNIIPIVSERTVKTNLRYDRLEKIITEASEQSGRGCIPNIKEKLSLEDALEEAKETNDANFFFHVDGERPALGSDVTHNKIGAFIGPEGGWNSEEVSWAYNKDLAIVKISDLTLRGETAGIVASYLSFFVNINS